MSSIISTIAEAVREGLSLWKTYLEKKAEMYDLHLKKRRHHALNIAEDAFDVVREIFTYVSENADIPDNKKRGLDALKKKYYKYNRKFNDYD